MTPATGIIRKEAYVNGDRRIGIEEAVYALQWVAGLRPQTTDQIETALSTMTRNLSPDITETELNDLVTGNKRFALDLYQAIRAHNELASGKFISSNSNYGDLFPCGRV